MRLRFWNGLVAWWLWPAVVMGLVLAATPGQVSAAPDKDKERAGDAAGREVYEPGKVWPVHITLSAAEFAAIQPRGGFGAPPKEPAKPADPKRDVHRNQFGADLPWGTGSVVVGDETFEKVGIRYKG